MLGEFFEKIYGTLKDSALKFIWFDFHYECRKMQWGNLSKLIHMI